MNKVAAKFGENLTEKNNIKWKLSQKSKRRTTKQFLKWRNTKT